MLPRRKRKRRRRKPMGRLFTMPFSSDPGVFEGDTYKGNVNTATQFGVLRLDDKDTGEEYHLHSASGRFIQEGWRFGRRMEDQDETTGTPTVFGEWRPLHAQGEPSREYTKLLVKEDKEVQASPGNNMKDPDGFLIWYQGGTIAQPGTGEQKRGEWTGELVWLVGGVEVESPTQPPGGVAVILP
jgi:hypothetical protein